MYISTTAAVLATVVSPISHTPTFGASRLAKPSFSNVDAKPAATVTSASEVDFYGTETGPIATSSHTPYLNAPTIRIGYPSLGGWNASQPILHAAVSLQSLVETANVLTFV